MLEKIRQKVAAFFFPSPAGAPPSARKPVGASFRMYAAAKTSRLTSGWGAMVTSEDAEMSTSIRTLRQRSRQLIRDAAYAKRAKMIVVNNIVGQGIGIQGQVMTSRNDLNKRINDEIEEVWNRWCRADSCHTGGVMHFSDLERAAMGQVFEAGEIFIRKHYSRFGNSEVPYCLELIEPERVLDEFQPSVPARIRLGIESDEFHRPIAYYIRSIHPGEIVHNPQEIDRVERVPAEYIIHLRIVDRWPQTRGVPWLHTVARRLNDMDGYSEAEITAARGAAAYMGIIETPDIDGNFGGETENDSGELEMEIEPGLLQKLNPGEKFNFVNPNRPNANMDPFMRLMLREVAAGSNVSYESISRDYSQSNYSSSRLALIDDRDLWRTLQRWFIRSFREIVHREWLQMAIYSRAITSIGVEQFAMDPEKFAAVRFKARGWSWIDPTKEVDAYKAAVMAGFMTVSEVIALTSGGRDLEDVLMERKQELDLMKASGLSFDTDPGAEQKKTTPTKATDTGGDMTPEEMMTEAGGNGSNGKNN